MSNPKIFLQPELIEGDNIDIAQDGKTISSNTPLENITNTDITEVEDGQALIYDETSGKWVNGEGGTPIEPNPAAAATDTLSTIKIDNTVFSIGGGGTGDAVLYPLTTAEYNALTPEQKMDEDVLYLLTDGGSGGGGGGGSEVIPNPQGEPTDTLETISIDGTVYDIESGVSDVSVTQVQSTGTKIATITVDNVDTDLYAPSGGSTNSYGYNFPSDTDGVNGDIYCKIANISGQDECIENTITLPTATWTTVPLLKSANEYTTLTISGTSNGYSYSYTYDVNSIGDSSSTATTFYITVQSGKISAGTMYKSGASIVMNKTSGAAISISSLIGVFTSAHSISNAYQKIDNTWVRYEDETGSEVIANPQDTATDTLTKISIDGDVYEIPDRNVDDVYVNGVSALDAQNIAQIKSYKEITKAEYDALPSSKLTDDILYCITDGGATEPGEYFNPVIYSTTEREIGVWIDGKPLYELTLNCGQAPNNGVVNYNLPSNNYDYIIITEGCLYNSTTKSSLPLNLVRTDNSNLSNGCFLAMEQNQIRVNDASDRSAFNVYVTIRYTKTTDTPGSGKYTTLGVPSAHYSTDEQVIGTWIDGKPLYQKVLDYNSTVINTRVDHDVSNLNIETLVDYKGWAQRITGSSKYIIKDGYVLTSEGQTYSFYVRYYDTGQQIQTILTLPSAESTDRQVVIIQYTKTTD